jgi:hypothetical protein
MKSRCPESSCGCIKLSSPIPTRKFSPDPAGYYGHSQFFTIEFELQIPQTWSGFVITERREYRGEKHETIHLA